MTNLRSHPNLQLSEHIAQVRSAIDGLCCWHSEGVISQEIRRLIQKVVCLHDIGKGTAAFQKYIEDPPAYVDNPMDKAHTPMSTILTLLLAREEGWDVLDTMLVSAVIFGHHRGLPSVERLREIGSGMLPKILKRQIGTLSVDLLIQHSGIDISNLNLADRPWAKAQQYLDKVVLPAFEGLSIENAVRFRLKSQLVFSFLLEADKALLAVKEPQKYLHREPRHWMSQWVEQKIGFPKDTVVNRIRRSIRDELKKKTEEIQHPGIS